VLANRWRETSPNDVRYNCIAWAAGDVQHFWWPLNGGFWPASVARVLDLATFVDAYATLGYTPCGNGSFEIGTEKIAIYCASNGEPTHAARQIDSGLWTSKLGQSWDIEHSTPSGVEGPLYGSTTQFLGRSLTDVSRIRLRVIYLLLIARA